MSARFGYQTTQKAREKAEGKRFYSDLLLVCVAPQSVFGNFNGVNRFYGDYIDNFIIDYPQQWSSRSRVRVKMSFAATVLEASTVAQKTQACPKANADQALPSLIDVVKDTKEAVRSVPFMSTHAATKSAKEAAGENAKRTVLTGEAPAPGRDEVYVVNRVSCKPSTMQEKRAEAAASIQLNRNTCRHVPRQASIHTPRKCGGYRHAADISVKEPRSLEDTHLIKRRPRRRWDLTKSESDLSQWLRKQPLNQTDSEEDNVYPKGDASDLGIGPIRSGAHSLRDVKKSGGKYHLDEARVRCVRRKQRLKSKQSATTSPKEQSRPETDDSTGPSRHSSQSANKSTVVVPSQKAGNVRSCSKAPPPVRKSLSWMHRSRSEGSLDTVDSVVHKSVPKPQERLVIKPDYPSFCIDLSNYPKPYIQWLQDWWQNPWELDDKTLYEYQLRFGTYELWMSGQWRQVFRAPRGNHPEPDALYQAALKKDASSHHSSFRRRDLPDRILSVLRETEDFQYYRSGFAFLASVWKTQIMRIRLDCGAASSTAESNY